MAGVSCGYSGQCTSISSRELAELRLQALEWAKGYVLSNEAIEAEHKKRLSLISELSKETLETTGAKRLPKDRQDFREIYRSAVAEMERERALRIRIPAVKEVRGVQLEPLSRNRCKVRVDFVASGHTLAEAPPATILFERFETTNGAYYWKINKVEE